MQARSAVTDVVRVVARQHTRMRGLVCEVAQTTGAERTSAAGWLSHYVVLHTAAERLGLRREPSFDVRRVVPPRQGPLLGLALGLAAASALEESAICRNATALEEAVVQHARAQERAVLPRLLAGWRTADLVRAAAAFEAADLVFDRGPIEPIATAGDSWSRAIADIERLLGSLSGDQEQATPDDVTPA